MFYSRNPRERAILGEKSVSVIGCGSIGSSIAEMLVRAGLGRITLIDPEVFEVENAGRHVLTQKDIGRPKVDALAGRLLEINPDLRVEARRERFSDADGMLLCCVDSYRCESLVNSVSLEKRAPALFVGVYGAAHAGEIFFSIPGRTACLECFAQFRKQEEAPVSEDRYTDPDFDETRAPGQAGLWGSLLVVSGVAFQVALGLLGAKEGVIDCDRPLWIMNFDYPGLQPYAVSFAKVARGCAVCDESKLDELTV